MSAPAPALSSAQPLYDTIVVQQPPKIVGYESHLTTKSTSENPTFQEAINGPDKDKWIAAMKKEIDSIDRNETTRLVELP
jgi:hypothetical protein